MDVGHAKGMYVGRIVFAQLIDHIPPYEFSKCVERYGGNYKFRGFSCLDQFLCLVVGAEFPAPL